MKIIENIRYNESIAPCLDVYLPEKDSFPVFVYFHGGGLTGGDKADKSLRDAFYYLAERGVAVISANYRMYPDCAYPDFIEDGSSVVAWAFENMESYGKTEGIYVGGSSAGGYISMMLCFDGKWLGAHGIDPLRVAGWFHDAGQPTAHYEVLRRTGRDDRRVIIDETAPIFHIGLNKEYSRMRFIVSDNDMANRYEQTMLMLKTLECFGVKNYDHVLMHGDHCAYCGARDEDGNVKLGVMILNFLSH